MGSKCIGGGKENLQRIMNPVKVLIFHEWSIMSDTTEMSSRIKIRNMSLDSEFGKPTDEDVSVV